MRTRALVLAVAMAIAVLPAAAQMQPRELDSPPAASAPPPAPQPQAPQARPPTPSPAVTVPTPAPGAARTGPAWQTLETSNFGQWTYSALRHANSGNAACAVHTHWHDTGRQLRLVALEQPVSINLTLSDPRWTLREGAIARGTIAIDGASFTAEFQRIDDSLMSTQLASNSDAVRRFMQTFRAGNTMRVTLPGDAFTAGLRGTSAAMDAMTRCIAQTFGASGRPPVAPAAPGTKG